MLFPVAVTEDDGKLRRERFVVAIEEKSAGGGREAEDGEKIVGDELRVDACGGGSVVVALKDDTRDAGARDDLSGVLTCALRIALR